MQVEVALPNPDGVLLPGAYVQVTLPLAGSRTLVVPANALLFRGRRHARRRRRQRQTAST